MGRWMLPDKLKLCYLDCYNKIVKLKLVEDSDVVLWNGSSKINSHFITSVLFVDWPRVDWYKVIWFKEKVINYTLYCYLALYHGLKTFDAFFI